MFILFLKAVVLIPVTLLPILNPLGIAPVFANLLGNVSRSTEKRIARQVAINCWFMLVAAIFIGSHVLTFFGISLPIVRVGGGLLDWVISVGSAALGAALTALVIFLCYNYAHKLVNLMGRLGTMVVLRLSAFILLCIGIQIFWSGMSALLAEAGISGVAP